jgi:hypothetical protein
MFLIKTLRSATGFSTSNFSPSLAEERTEVMGEYKFI